jgi:hypothetical protein
MRIATGALLGALTGFMAGLLAGPLSSAAQAQATPAARASVPVAATTATDISAQRRRPLRRVPIYRQEEWAPDVYPRYNPGPNAVRDCTAHYVQEYRPSGTVITPRMNCYWRPG